MQVKGNTRKGTQGLGFACAPFLFALCWRPVVRHEWQTCVLLSSGCLPVLGHVPVWSRKLWLSMWGSKDKKAANAFTLCQKYSSV